MSATKRTMMCPECGFRNSGWPSRCQNCGANLPKDEITGAVRGKEKDSSQRGCLFWSAFFAGVAGSGFSTLFGALFVAKWLFFLPLIIVPWVGLVLAWRWPLIGGLIGGVILAVAGYLPIYTLMILTRVDPPEALGAAMALGLVLPFITLPLVSSGVLMVSSGVLNIVRWRKGREHPKKQTD